LRAMTVNDTIDTLSRLAIAMRIGGTIFVAQTSHAARCGDVTNGVGARRRLAMRIHCTSDARVSGGKASRSWAAALSVRNAGDASLAPDIASRSKRRRTMLVFEASYASVGCGIASRRSGGTILIGVTIETYLSAHIATEWTLIVRSANHTSVRGEITSGRGARTVSVAGTSYTRPGSTEASGQFGGSTVHS